MFQQLRKYLIPLLKGLPFIVLIFGAAIYVAIRAINYSTPLYQSTVKIKLDDQRFGFSKNNLFKDFDIFSTVNKIASEVELIKSPVLMDVAMKKLNFDVVYYRKGEIRNTELYNDSPFEISYYNLDGQKLAPVYYLSVAGDSSATLSFSLKGQNHKYHVSWGDTMQITGGQICIRKNDFSGISYADQYFFKILDNKEQAALFKKHFEVKTMDDDLPVIRISSKYPVAEKNALFLNTLAEAYIEDYITTKSGAAAKTVDFIDEKLAVIKQDLYNAEIRLEEFKKENEVVNTYQETETGLRKLSQLKVQLINLEINAASLQELYDYLTSDADFSSATAGFGFGDLLFTEFLKKLKQLESERAQLLTIYQPVHEQVRLKEQEIEDVRRYLIEGIKTARNDLSSKKKKLEREVELLSHQFDDLPERERLQLALERDFRLKESIYNFLAEKQIEASIASSPGISFHRIIQYAEAEKQPVSPNKTLIMFVAGLMGLFTGIFLVLIYDFSKAQIDQREELEKLTVQEVIGQVKKNRRTNPKSGQLLQLVKILDIRRSRKRDKIICISSSIKKEGKTFVAKNMAEVYVKKGLKTALLYFNNQKTEAQMPVLDVIEEIDLSKLSINGELQEFCFSDYHGQQVQHGISLSGLREMLKKFTSVFDKVIIVSPPATQDLNSLLLMQTSQLNIYLVRSQFTKTQFIKNIDVLAEEYALKNLYVLLNDVKGSVDFTGRLSGKQYADAGLLKRIWQRIEWPEFKLKKI